MLWLDTSIVDSSRTSWSYYVGEYVELVVDGRTTEWPSFVILLAFFKLQVRRL